MPYGGKISKFIFYNSPTIIKNLMSSSFGYIQRGERYGDYFERYYENLRESQYWNNKKLKKNSYENTINFITRVLDKTKYYRDNDYYNLWSKYKEIKKLPLLKKEKVRENQEKLYIDNLRSLKHKWAHTSGTTGKSLIFPLSLNTFQREYAFRTLHYDWSGISLLKRDKIAICSGHPITYYNRKKPPFWVYDYPNNWLILSSYHLNEKNLPFYINELEKFSPQMIHGYPSSIYILALGYKKYGRGILKLKSIYTSSETLLDYQRSAIEKAFQVKVFNWYGNSEMVANIVECEKGELHLKYEHSYIEILNENNKECIPGETGRIVSTGFGNDAFPLIRYEVGDCVTVAKNQTSKCGRGGLLIERIEGREEDYIVTPDGKLVGRLDHLFKDSQNVIEAQIFQEKINEIYIHIVKDVRYTKEDENIILNEARLRLGNSINIKFEYVDKIEKTKNGKFRFIESKLNQEELIKSIV